MRDVVEVVDLPERLARRRVGEVDLDERPLRRASSASRSATDVWVRPPALTIATSKSRRVEPVDERALVVRLEEVDLEPSSAGPGQDAGVDLVERLVPVDLRLARARAG